MNYKDIVSIQKRLIRIETMLYTLCQFQGFDPRTRDELPVGTLVHHVPKENRNGA